MIGPIPEFMYVQEIDQREGWAGLHHDPFNGASSLRVPFRELAQCWVWDDTRLPVRVRDYHAIDFAGRPMTRVGGGAS